MIKESADLVPSIDLRLHEMLRGSAMVDEWCSASPKASLMHDMHYP